MIKVEIENSRIIPIEHIFHLSSVFLKVINIAVICFIMGAKW